MDDIACQAPLPWDFPSKNTGVGFYFSLQGIFPAQGLNPCLLYWQGESLPWGTRKALSAITEYWVKFLMLFSRFFLVIYFIYSINSVYMSRISIFVTQGALGHHTRRIPRNFAYYFRALKMIIVVYIHMRSFSIEDKLSLNVPQKMYWYIAYMFMISLISFSIIGFFPVSCIKL